MQTIRFKSLNLSNDDFLLDMGCGEGRHSIGAYIETKVNVLGFDLSMNDLRIARGRLDDFDTSDIQSLCQFGRADIISLPFADCSLDAVICSEVLEHVDSPQKSIEELIRVLKPGGILALSVPRYLPELICWKLSKEYSKTPGGHVRIFKHKELRKLIQKESVSYQSFHWAHALHSPYWWLKCIFWKNEEEHWLVKKYHEFLIWDLMKNPLITRFLEMVLKPFIGKSLVMYFVKD